jgi:outer membrane protein insertion porin family
MKANWADELRIIIVFALLAGLAPLPVLCGQSQNRKTTIQPSSSTEESPLVVGVRIVSEDGHVLSESPSGISVGIGKPLDRDQVAASLRALYRTGDYADVRAVENTVEGGARIDFVVRENLFFNRIVIQGLQPPPTEASAAAAMQITLGDVYRPETLATALQRLQAVLQEDGLYQAKTASETFPHFDAQEMDIVVRVTPGPRATVSRILLTNNTDYPDAEILSLLKMEQGSKLTSARIQRGTERIRKFLVKKGYLGSRVSIRRGDYDLAKNSVFLTLDVTSGPLVTVEVNGAHFSKGELKNLLPIYQEGSVDADLLEEGKRNLQDRLERQGYFDATVSYSLDSREVQRKGSKTKESEESIIYTVERGERHKLVGIGVTGNTYFSADLLKSRLQIYPAALGSRGRFSRRLFETDRQSMENLYRANGFLQAKVEAQVQDNYKGKEGDIFVRFAVQEEEQTRVASLAIEGNKSFSTDEILDVVASSPGQPFSDFNVATDRANILAMYYNDGFPEADVRATAEKVESNPITNKAEANGNSTPGTKRKAKKTPSETGLQSYHLVRLTYHIDEGPQTLVRRVLISGYVHTRPGIIRRQIEIEANQPLRAGEVVDTQRRLYNLGIYNRVTIAPQNSQGSDPDKNVAVLVEEAKRYTLAYGGGFEVQRLASTTNPTGGQIQASPRGILEISTLNLTGRADSLSLKLRGSTIEDRALLGYSIPNTFGSSHYSTQATAYTEKSQDINTFTETQYEGSVQLTGQMTPFTTMAYRYAFRKVLVSNLNSHIAPEEIPLFEQPTLVSEFDVTWQRDARDNPADATKGNYNSLDFGVASTSIGSSASFWRILYQNSTYHPIKRRFSFARSIRLGILEPFANTESLSFPPPTATQCTGAAPPGPTPEIIPLPERYFAGGGTSLRGFALNQAGPRDACTGFPVGGQAMLVLNQEFRFPMHLPFVGSRLGGTLFYDAGNVYSKLSRVTLRWSSPKPVFNPANLTTCLYNCTNELNYLSHTVGFGIRYATPVGPIRVDLGYQINRPFFVVPISCPSSVPTCTLGSQGFQATQLPRLQIFFNLGSTF